MTKPDKIIYYTYQCNYCFIISGHSGQIPEDAPFCCREEPMRAIRHEIKEKYVDKTQ